MEGDGPIRPVKADPNDPRSVFWSVDNRFRLFAAVLVLTVGPILLAVFVSPWFWILEAVVVVGGLIGLVLARVRKGR